MPPTISKPSVTIFDSSLTSYGNCKIAFENYLKEGGEKIPVKIQAEVRLQLAFCYAIGGLMGEAEKEINFCNSYILKHGRPEQQACLYHVLSRIHLHHSRLEEGLQVGLQAVHLFRALPWAYFLRISCTVCGHLCSSLNLFTEAMDYMSEAYSIAVRNNDKRGALTCLANLNDMRLNVLSEKDCIAYNLQLEREIKQELGNMPRPILAGTYLQLAHLYLRTEKIAGARAYILKAETALKKMENELPPHYFLFTNLFGLKAELAAVDGDEVQMLQCARECGRRGRLANKLIPEVDACFIMFKYYLKQRKLPKAYKILQQAGAILPGKDRSAFYIQLLENKCLYYRAKGNAVAELETFKEIYEHKIKTHQQVLRHRNKYLSLVHDLELKKRQLEEQHIQLNLKTQELNMASYHLQQRTQLLDNLRESLDDLKQSKAKPEVIFKTLNKTINRAFNREEDEKKFFREKFDEANREFIARVHAAYPALTVTECRICALLRSGFNTKEIANLLSADARNVENHRTNVRRKLGLARDESLTLALNKIV